MLKSLGYAVMPVIYRFTNGGMKEAITTGRLVVSWTLCAMVVVPVTFWLADLFWGGIDMPCVQFARWVEGKASEDFEKEDRLQPQR